MNRGIADDDFFLQPPVPEPQGRVLQGHLDGHQLEGGREALQRLNGPSRHDRPLAHINSFGIIIGLTLLRFDHCNLVVRSTDLVKLFLNTNTIYIYITFSSYSMNSSNIYFHRVNFSLRDC